MGPHPNQTKSWILAKKPTGNVVLGDSPDATFKLETRDLPSPIPQGHLLLKVLQFSNDPAQRGWIDAKATKERLYVPPVEEGDIMRSRAVVEVVGLGEEVKSSWTVGQLATASTGWTEHAVLKEAEVTPAPELPAGIDHSILLGHLGLTGLTAYYGLIEIGRATSKDVVVVSGAAGATGSAVVQLAKHVFGCKKVVGIAGGEEKCRHVENHLGADECVDYRAEDFEDRLKKATGGGQADVDVFFDNVGGDILSLMLTRMALNGRIAVCGSIATYNARDAHPIRNWHEVIFMRIEIKGFIVMDMLADKQKTDQARQTLAKAVKEGKLKHDSKTETVVEAPGGIAGVPKVWTRLFEGANTGKLVTVLSRASS